MFFRLLKCLGQAFRGYVFWIMLKSKYKITTTDYIILCPGDDPDSLPIILELSSLFIKENKADNALGLFVKNDSGEYIENAIQTSNIKRWQFISAKQCDHILKLYNFNQFHPALIIASLEKPQGRYGKTIPDISTYDLYKHIAFGF